MHGRPRMLTRDPFTVANLLVRFYARASARHCRWTDNGLLSCFKAKFTYFMTLHQLMWLGGVVVRAGSFPAGSDPAQVSHCRHSLPVHVREEMDFYRFERLLKTHTFSLAYNVY